MPWIDDGEHTIYDSTVINEYLNDAYPEPPLLPADPVRRAAARALENYGDEGVLSKFLPLIWMPWWSPEDQRDQESMEKGRVGLRDQVFPFLEEQLEDDTITEGRLQVIGVMEKDPNRFTGTKGWGFEDFKLADPNQRSVTNMRDQCFSCHESQKANDYVFSTYRK